MPPPIAVSTTGVRFGSKRIKDDEFKTNKLDESIFVCGIRGCKYKTKAGYMHQMKGLNGNKSTKH